jgi:hypothetical protein
MTQIQSRDQEILSTLSRRVRLFSLTQIASFWWGEGEVALANTRRRLAKLTGADLLRRLSAMAIPIPDLPAPMARWRPGEPEPDFGAAAWKLQKRWKEPPQKTTIYIATARAAGIYGGRARGQLKRQLQATHDLGVASLYLRLLRHDPAAANSWVGEDMLRLYRLGQKIPDAALADSAASTPNLILEFGGAYDVRRLRRFHEDCLKKTTPYEIW